VLLVVVEVLVVEVVVVEVVVVVGGTVVVVVVLVVVVVFVGARFASIKYDVPYQASGLPQHTPALNRYVPGSRFLDI
jgi:hypothetical protein